MNAPVTPWDNPGFNRHPQVLYPDQLGERVDLYDQLAIVEHYERLARKARRRGRFGFANRATRQSPSQSSLSRLFERVSAIAWGDMLFGAACGLLVGMLTTVGLAYVWALFL